MVQIRRHAESFMAFDDRHTPLLISTFRGPIDLDAARWHDQVASKVVLSLAASGKRVVYVTDARLAEVPGPEVRKFWADRIVESRITMDSMLGTFVVIDSPLLRGVLTAIEWLSHGVRKVEWLPTLSQAVTLANLRFQAAGFPPVELHADSYEVPSEPSRSTDPVSRSPSRPGQPPSH